MSKVKTVPIPLSTLIKLASVVVHVEELLDQKDIALAIEISNVAQFDRAAIRTLTDDYEVVTLLKELRVQGFMPSKRNEPPTKTRT